MRRLMIAVVAVLLLGAAGAGGWWGYQRLTRDPLKEARALLARGDAQAAALVLREAAQRHPANALLQMRLAQVQLLLGEPVAAEKELRAAQADGYRGTDLTPLLARALLAQKRGAELLAQFAPDGLPPADAADLMVARGLAQLAAGNVDAARDSAEAAERLAPTLAAAPLLAARVAVVQRQYGWALACLDRALARDPTQVEALLLKAGVLRADGRLTEALPVLDAAVAAAKTPPDIAGARLARAGALLAAGKDAGALADLDVLLRQVPRSPGGNYLKMLAEVRAKNWGAADAALEMIQPLLPRMPRGEYYLALIKANLNQAAQAADAIDHYTARAPGDPDGWRLLARIDLLAGHREQAATALARLGALPAGTRAAEVAAHADTPQDLTELASLQLGAGETQAAAQDLERSLEALPTPAETAARAVVTALRRGDLDRARAALATLGRDPQAGPERLAALTGAVRIAELDLDGARAAFADGLKAVPESQTLRLDLARVLLLQGDAAAAERALAPVLAAAPASPPVLASMIDIYAAEQRPDRIHEALAAARAAQPDSPALLLTEASLTAREKGVPAALAQLEAAPPALARAPQVMALRARLLIEQGRLKDAIAVDRQLLDAVPGNQAVTRQLIDLLLADHQNDAAVALARDALKASPANATAMQSYVATTWRAAGEAAALAAAETLRRDPANLPAARMLKGAVLMAAGHPDQAAAAFAAERAIAPAADLITAEAGALRAAGHETEAQTLLRDALAKQADPTLSDALAALEIATRQYSEAAAALKDVLAVRPDDVAALNNLAWVDQQLHADGAEALARRAYLLAPGGQTADTLGWILAQEGQKPLALLLLRQAAARLPQDASVQYHFAVALNDNGQTQQAGALLDALLASKAPFDERDAAQKLRQQLPAAPAPTPAAAPAQ